jgi:hypothetical protein
VRVEDVWERLDAGLRRHSYNVTVRKDGAETPTVLDGVAPDARIFLDFDRSFEMEFR